jgi:hypothetical protein
MIAFLKYIFKNNPLVTELVFIGAANGYGYFAVAYALYLMKKDNVKIKHIR